MKKIISLMMSMSFAFLVVLLMPKHSSAAGGIYASGGGTKTVGQTFTVSVVASGATFNALQGTISVSGSVQVISFSPGSATWVSQPSNGAQFVGLVSPAVSSLTVATIKLRATAVGGATVSVSGAQLANGGEYVGTGSSNANITIEKGKVLPGQVEVTSTSHSDQNESYDATNIELSWNKGSGVTGFSYLLDQTEDTTPPSTKTSADTSVTYENKEVGIWYFHIKANGADGWGPISHFKITIKEPDAKVDESLSKPIKIKIKKTNDFESNIRDGQVSGIKIIGVTEPNYVVNISLVPNLALPEGKSLSATSDENGAFEILVDYFIPVGHYIMTVQGQFEKVLTPATDEIIFEIAQANGGKINILDESDVKGGVMGAVISPIMNNWPITVVVVVAIIIIVLAIWLVPKYLKKRQPAINPPDNF